MPTVLTSDPDSIRLFGKTQKLDDFIAKKFSESDLKKLTDSISKPKDRDGFLWIYTGVIKPELKRWLLENPKCSATDVNDATDVLLIAAKIELTKIIDSSNEEKTSYIQNRIFRKFLEE